jgi:hypothetical protein
MAGEEDNPLARPFDVVVLGTGLVESIVAAAAARAGQRVLHLDATQFYGGEAASLPITQWSDWAAAGAADGTIAQAALRPRERRMLIRPTTRAHEAAPPLPEAVARLSRRFTLDAGPRFVLARGAMANLMVSSGVAGYMDFKAVDAAFVVDAAADGRRLELVKVRQRPAPTAAAVVQRSDWVWPFSVCSRSGTQRSADLLLLRRCPPARATSSRTRASRCWTSAVS